jgi:PAS domain S-box-containing protein
MISVPRSLESSGARAPAAEPHLLVLRAIFSIIIVAGAIVLLISIRDLVRHPVGATWFVLVGLTVGTGWATLRMRRVPVTFSISDTFTMAAALLFGPAAGTVTVVLDVLVILVRNPPSNRADLWLRILFNTTAPALAMWVSAETFFAITTTGPLANQPGTIREVVGPLALFATMYFLLNTGLIAVAVAREGREPVAAVWRKHLSALWLTYFGGASIAGIIILMTVARVVDVKALALVLPLLFILHVTYKAAIDRVQEQLEHLTQISRYAAAMRSTADAVLITDPDERVTLMNPAAEQLTGWTEGDAAGRPSADVFHVIDPPTRAPDDRPRRDNGDTIREYLLVRRDGSDAPVEEMHARIRNPDGAIVGTVRTFRDISARKAVEAERNALLESERKARSIADAANRLKDEFLATLSHELRTPASGILGWTRLLKTGRMDQAQTRQALDALERSARAQATLLDDLLDMSRIVRGTLRIDPRPTDISEALKNAIDTVTPAIRSKAIDLRVELTPNVPPVHADADRMRQVFWNLLSNAVKFTEPGGSILVSVGRERDQVRVEVADNGRGIEPDVLPFIFDRFRQADSSTTRSHGGLGLGLAIVRHLVEAHGGTVTATSEGRGRGARFVICLPARPSRGVEQVEAAS